MIVLYIRYYPEILSKVNYALQNVSQELILNHKYMKE